MANWVLKYISQTTGKTCGSQKRYLLRNGRLESSRVDAVQGVRLHRVRVASVAGRLLDDRRVLTNRLRGAGDGGLRGRPHVVVQRFVQLLVGVGAALRVRVLVVGGVAAVGAVHGILTARRRQVRQPVVVDVQVILGCPISLGNERSSLLLRKFLLELRSPRNLQKSALSPPGVLGRVYCTLDSCSALDKEESSRMINNTSTYLTPPCPFIKCQNKLHKYEKTVVHQEEVDSSSLLQSSPRHNVSLLDVSISGSKALRRDVLNEDVAGQPQVTLAGLGAAEEACDRRSERGETLLSREALRSLLPLLLRSRSRSCRLPVPVPPLAPA
ncbi:hypothetical protein EYF80_003150 [Liparis tanakae]|uniref:Uncharacterized protein n=1 Tax=Liparis tanakae TaxID=230148 RepID=A0A4Z2JBJ8_9TELE|nr:hypothetical protein EYF80_003150 [Liparis tanakae]